MLSLFITEIEKSGKTYAGSQYFFFMDFRTQTKTSILFPVRGGKQHSDVGAES